MSNAWVVSSSESSSFEDSSSSGITFTYPLSNLHQALITVSSETHQLFRSSIGLKNKLLGLSTLNGFSLLLCLILGFYFVVFSHGCKYAFVSISAISFGISRLESDEVRKELVPVLGETLSRFPLENLSLIIASLHFILCFSFEFTYQTHVRLPKSPKTMNKLTVVMTGQDVFAQIRQLSITIWYIRMEKTT